MGVYDDLGDNGTTLYRGQQEAVIEDDVLSGPGALTLIPQHGAAQGPGAMAELESIARIAQYGERRSPDALMRAARAVGQRLAGFSNSSGSNRALYSFPVKGGRVEGPTVQLAEALAQEYGFLWTGVRIDRMEGDRIFLTAMVVDVKAGTATTRPAVVSLPPAPGKFSEKADQAARWESMQMQSAISKTVRTAIIHALPAWMVESAVQGAQEYIRGDVLKGASLEKAADDSVVFYESKHGVPVDALEARIGSPRAMWTSADIADLRGLAARLKAGVTTVAREFPDVQPAVASPPKHEGMAAEAAKSAKATKGAEPAKESPAFDPVAEIEAAENAKGWDKAAIAKARAKAGLLGPLSEAGGDKLSAYLDTLTA